MIHNCIPSKDRVTLSYTKDTSLLAEFNNCFASVGSPTAQAAEKIANDHNLQLISPLTQTTTHPSDKQFDFDNASMAEVQRIVS